MDAESVLNERHILDENSFVEMVVWRLQSPLPGSGHSYKYRIAYVVDDRCEVRYDNDFTPYVFSTPQALLDDFWSDVNNRRP